MYIYKLHFNIFGTCVSDRYISLTVKHKISESHYTCILKILYWNTYQYFD